MRIVIYIWTAGLLLFCSAGVTPAQDVPEGETLVHVTQHFLDDFSQDAAHFLEQIQSTRLDQHAVRLSTQTDLLHEAYISLSYEDLAPENTRVHVRLDQPDHLSPSPILSPYFWSPRRSIITFNRLDLRIGKVTSSDYIAGLSLYAVGKCAPAEDYFAAVERALQTWGEVVTPDPEMLRDTLDIYRGNCALLAGDYATARQLYESHLDYVSPAINLAWIYLQTERESQAFEILENLINANMSSEITVFALRRRAQLYALAFHFDDAIADMDAAIELEPANPELYVERGNTVMLLYEWDRVLENYNTALELDPTYADAYFRRGILYYSLLERKQALDDFERYLEVAPRGENAAEAGEFVDSIRTEIEALGD